MMTPEIIGVVNTLIVSERQAADIANRGLHRQVA